MTYCCFPANNQSMCVAMKTQGPGVGLWLSPNCTTANKYICQYDRAGYSTPLTTTTTAAPTCPDGWHLNNGYCYKVCTVCVNPVLTSGCVHPHLDEFIRSF